MTATSPQALHFASADDSEELARAELYGLLSRLWHAPPDEALLAQFRVAVTQAPEPGGFLEAPWGDLVAALRATTLAEAAAEHEALFHGVGKPEVFAYGSYHLSGFLNERPLAVLREDLARLGLTRDEASDDVAVCNLEQQRRFFRAHLQPWVPLLCDAVLAQPRAVTWRAVANLTAAFMQVETQAFDLLET